MAFEGVLPGGLAAAYFLASFGFAGYVLKIYVELRDSQRSLTLRLDRFRKLEASFDEATSEVLERVTKGGFSSAQRR